MRFSRCGWSFRDVKGWNPQRIAAAGRAVRKEAAKVEAARDQVALFPELAAEIQPDFETVEQRQEAMDRREALFITQNRAQWVAVWRRARAAYFATDPIRRAGLRRLWRKLDQPSGPYDLATFLQIYNAPGVSPWTYLRKLRMMVLWNHHGYPKPPHFLQIVSNFTTLGPVRWPRLRTQTMLSIAKIRGVSLRQVEKDQARKRYTAFQTEL